MKRALSVLLVGLGIVGLSALAGRRGADERFAYARSAVDADCRAFRSQPAHRHADVCRIDHYSPRALSLYQEAKASLDHAQRALGHGDVRAAEAEITRAVAIADDLDHVGTSLAQIVRVSIVKRILDLAATHREIDATRLLRDVHVDETAKHPFAVEALSHRWYLAHWNELGAESSRSARDLAGALEDDTAAYAEMERALVERRDIAECEAIGKKHELSGEMLCAKLDMLLETSARLDAVQRGRLSSAAR